MTIDLSDAKSISELSWDERYALLDEAKRLEVLALNLRAKADAQLWAQTVDERHRKILAGLEYFWASSVSSPSTVDIEDAHYDDGDRNDQSVTHVDEANVVGSRIKGTTKHRLLLDLDHEAMLIESSTSGHHHLYVDVEIEHDKWVALMKALADAGVIEKGYASVSISRGHADLRLPWIKKPRR